MNNRVGFGPRFLAMLLDMILVGAVSVVLTPFVGRLLGGAMAPAHAGGDVAAMLMGSASTMGLIATLYFLTEAFTGWTLGKRILRLQIGTTDGRRAPARQLITRYALKNIGSILSLAAGVVGVAAMNTVGSLLGLVVFLGIFLVLGQARQTLHDRLARTAVWRRSEMQAHVAPANHAA